MGTDSDGYIDIRGDGRVVLYKRQHLKNPKWQARISVPNATGYKVVSTKLFDFDEAKRFALNRYEELYMQVKAGGQLKTKSFKQVCDEWKADVKEHGRTRRDGSWDTTIERIDSYALEFFGAKRIDEIREADFTAYWAWRRQNYAKKPPTDSTLKRERTSIMPVFKFALSKGYISKLPETNTPKAKTSRRPTFSKKEWEAIQNASREWIKAADELATTRDRYYAQKCFLLLAYTGLRIGELRGLRWCDLSTICGKNEAGDPTEYLLGYVAKGKTGSREFAFQPGAEVVVKKLYKYRERELEAQHPDKPDIEVDVKEPVLCHPDGRPIMQYKHSFKSLLNFAKVPIELDGKPRTIYSIRHYYATQRLRDETNPLLLARQMGTSVEMLEKHYVQTTTAEVAAQVTKRKPSTVEVKSAKGGYPF